MTYYQNCWENELDEVIKMLGISDQDDNKHILNIQKKKNAALRIFAYNGNVHAVKIFLVLGANPYTRIRKDVFVDKSIGPDLSYKNFYTAIELAAMKNHPDIVKLFLYDDKWKNMVDNILHYFTVHQNRDMVKYLLDQFANDEGTNNEQIGESEISEESEESEDEDESLL